MKTAYITDSSAGFTMDQFAKEGIFSLPLQVSIGRQNYFDLENLTVPDALNAMKSGQSLTTSQPNYGLVEDLFAKLKEEGFERAVCVPICSGLSGTSSVLYAAGVNHGIPTLCADTGTTAYFQADSIRFIKNAVDHGMSPEDAVQYVHRCALKTNTLIVIDNLKQIKASGRLTPAAYHVANMLRIKPLLMVNKETDGKIDTIQKVLTFSKALNKMFEYMKSEVDPNVPYKLYVTHVDNYADAEIFGERARKECPNMEVEVVPLVTPVAAHVWLGGIAIQYFPKFPHIYDPQ